MNQERLTNREEIIAASQEALAAWRAGKLDEARRMAEHIRKSVSDFPKLTLLEAYIAQDKAEYLSELDILKNGLAELERTKSGDDSLAAEMWSMMGYTYHMLCQPKEAVAAFSRASDLEPNLPQRRIEASNAIFAANGAADYTAKDFQALYHRYEKLLAPIIPLPKRRFSHDRLRIGYLSADFCSHPVGKLMLPLFTHHDKTRFKIYCYAANATEDATTEKLRASADVWRNIRTCSDEDAANLIRKDEIDILVELGVHTKNNRLPILAYRPAAIQICGIGDVRSSGLSCVDYFLSDIYCAGDERSVREDFTEHVLLLPHTHFCFTPADNLPPVEPPPCLARGFVTFGSFNNASKLTDETLSLWNDILLRLPTSRLILKHKLFGYAEGGSYTKNRLKNLGFDLSRVELRGFSDNYLNEYNDIDVALDAYPYTGGMTTFEALSMGVPVVTRYGARHGTRFGLSILQNIGLGELAVSTKEKYIETSVALATETDLLISLRKKLRGFIANSPLSDGAQYAADVESAYETVWADVPKEDKNQ